MDINQYYRQAKEWQMDKERRAREDEIRRQSELAETWNYAKDEIRRTYPFDGAKLFEVEKGMTANFPIVGGNYCFDLALPNTGITQLYANDPLVSGVIRIVLNCVAVNIFKVVRYIVLVDSTDMSFDEPGDAFLACCENCGFKTDNVELPPSHS